MLTVLSPHGLEIELPANAEGMRQLRRLLEEQARPKLVPRGLTPAIILAEWERIGPCGAGKVRKGTPHPRHFTATGRPITSAFDLEPL
jgi:hypothetical protein